MSKGQIRNPDYLVFASLYGAQAVASVFWARAYPKSEILYSLSAPTWLIFALVWAWRATREEDHSNLVRRSSGVPYGLMFVLVAGLLCWGAYTAQTESRDVLAARIGYAVEFFAVFVGASYYLFGRRLILARKKTLKNEAVL
jgi:hypothetical protein